MNHRQASENHHQRPITGEEVKEPSGTRRGKFICSPEEEIEKLNSREKLSRSLKTANKFSHLRRRYYEVAY
ncbi:hypothetical protein CDAR_401991 [Caerostris darwini]|uniref:Uncharacterized protein n=1 Tax=Caerostris darwini TaxID=1538125 RepID=A0AAV4NUY6_9ARAC|nr:hypothetical protein CDAR_401991 [Caerostris darwini]